MNERLTKLENALALEKAERQAAQAMIMDLLSSGLPMARLDKVESQLKTLDDQVLPPIHRLADKNETQLDRANKAIGALNGAIAKLDQRLESVRLELAEKIAKVDAKLEKEGEVSEADSTEFAKRISALEAQTRKLFALVEKLEKHEVTIAGFQPSLELEKVDLDLAPAEDDVQAWAQRFLTELRDLELREKLPNRGYNGIRGCARLTTDRSGALFSPRLNEAKGEKAWKKHGPYPELLDLVKLICQRQVKIWQVGTETIDVLCELFSVKA